MKHSLPKSHSANGLDLGDLNVRHTDWLIDSG